MKIGQLKSSGVESASWATIPQISRDRTAEITGVESVSWATSPPILCDRMAEITRRENGVMGHDPTNFTRNSL